MVAQTSPYVSTSTGLQGIDEQVFIIKDEAQGKWDALKSWLRQTDANVLETRIPNELSGFGFAIHPQQQRDQARFGVEQTSFIAFARTGSPCSA